MDLAKLQAFRRERLQALIGDDAPFGKNVELGRALGYTDGSYVGQMLRGERPIDEKTIAAIEGIAGRSLRGWFAQPASAWPLTPELLRALSNMDDKELRRIENSIRGQLDMEPITRSQQKPAKETLPRRAA